MIVCYKTGMGCAMSLWSCLLCLLFITVREELPYEVSFLGSH